MGHPSTPQFRTFHALRIKGFASVDTLAEIADLPAGDVEQHLASLSDDGHALFREKRSLWQLTPEGREAHVGALADDVEGIDAAGALATAYPAFVEVNVAFKELCGAWQLRDGAPNEHDDADYDNGVIARLVEMHGTAVPIVSEMGAVLDRLAPYAGRLDASLAKLHDGDTTMFTGVMCNSYHDVWMELHEDLILTQGIDRQAEGSF